MKVGDKVLCKQNYIMSSGTSLFIKDVYYKILNLEFSDNSTYGLLWDNIPSCYWYWIGSGEEISNHPEIFSTPFSSIEIKGLNYYNEYFLTERELRKSKLNKIGI